MGFYFRVIIIWGDILVEAKRLSGNPVLWQRVCGNWF